MIARTHLWIVIGLVVGGFVLSAVAYPMLPPEAAPVHWDYRGHADGFGARWVDAVLLPACTAIIAALLVLAPRAGRWKPNFARFARTYGRIVVAVIAMLVCMHAVVLLKATGRPMPIERVMPALAGVAIAIVGNWMGKIRRNSLVGIRTPWTLASDVVWERTHRSGGYLIVGLGLATVAASIWGPPWAGLIVLVGGAIALVIWAMIYSWRISQRVASSDSPEGHATGNPGA